MARIRTLKPELWPKNSAASLFACTLYVVQEEDSSYFKIGIANHPIRRLSMLQCGNRRRLKLIAIYEGSRANCREIERAAHKYFGAPINSEWFYAERADDVLRYLNSFEGDAP